MYLGEVRLLEDSAGQALWQHRDKLLKLFLVMQGLLGCAAARMFLQCMGT